MRALENKKNLKMNPFPVFILSFVTIGLGSYINISISDESNPNSSLQISVGSPIGRREFDPRSEQQRFIQRLGSNQPNFRTNDETFRLEDEEFYGSNNATPDFK